MKTTTVNQHFECPSRLERELLEDVQLSSHYEGLTQFENSTSFYFKDSYDSADENYLVNTFLENFIDEHNDHEYEPRVVSLTSVKKADFREIDYRVELDCTLYPKRTFIRGELRKVEWFKTFESNAFSDLVLKVEMTYVRDSFGFPISRTTTRTWYNNNDTENEEIKTTHKNYSASPLAQIQEGLRRRGNIVNGIQLPTMGLMMEVLLFPPYSKSQAEILFMGRDFLDRFESEFDRFVKNSSTVTDIQDVNFGRKMVVVALENAALTTDTWLNETPATLQGASILQYLCNEFVDES